MFLKILAALVVLTAALWLLRARRPVAKKQPRRLAKPRAHDLVKCADCGTWLAPGQVCACKGRDVTNVPPERRLED